MSKLTIGMCVYDDFDGVYFTIQAIRMFHKEVIDEIEFVIINNNPDSENGQLTSDFVMNTLKLPFKYLEFTKFKGTSIRNKIFEIADTPYVLVTDCHVLFEPGSLKRLIDFYDAGLDEGNLLQGPLVHDTLDDVSTHFDKVWGDNMYGKWSRDIRYVDANSEPFEIEGQGLGVFSCRTDSWLGFNPHFTGFGGEEMYIHAKYKLFGKKALCLPFLQWVHRFARVSIPYPHLIVDIYRNYLIGRIELGLDFDDVEEQFAGRISDKDRDEAQRHVLAIFSEQVPTPGGCKCGKG